MGALAGFFLRCLKKHKANLAEKIEQEITLSDAELPLLSLKILELLKQHDRLTIAQIVALSCLSEHTKSAT